MIALRSIIFNILFPLYTFLLGSIGIIVVLIKSEAVFEVGRLWAKGVIFLLKHICNITYEIKGEKNLPKEPFIIASKHQSAWETAIFLFLLNRPVYVLKKELLSVPAFGHHLKKLKMIAVDRSGGSSALKDMVAQARDRLKDKRSIIIFPEGTRTKPGEKSKYHPGIAFLYLDDEINVPIVPVALNSGKFWHKDDYKRYPGKIILKYLKPIKKGLNRKEFMDQLQQTIDEESEKL